MSSSIQNGLVREYYEAFVPHATRVGWNGFYGISMFILGLKFEIMKEVYKCQPRKLYEVYCIALKEEVQSGDTTRGWPNKAEHELHSEHSLALDSDANPVVEGSVREAINKFEAKSNPNQPNDANPSVRLCKSGLNQIMDADLSVGLSKLGCNQSIKTVSSMGLDFLCSNHLFETDLRTGLANSGLTKSRKFSLPANLVNKTGTNPSFSSFNLRSGPSMLADNETFETFLPTSNSDTSIAKSIVLVHCTKNAVEAKGNGYLPIIMFEREIMVIQVFRSLYETEYGSKFCTNQRGKNRDGMKLVLVNWLRRKKMRVMFDIWKWPNRKKEGEVTADPFAIDAGSFIFFTITGHFTIADLILGGNISGFKLLHFQFWERIVSFQIRFLRSRIPKGDGLLRVKTSQGAQLQYFLTRRTNRGIISNCCISVIKIVVTGM